MFTTNLHSHHAEQAPWVVQLLQLHTANQNPCKKNYNIYFNIELHLVVGVFIIRKHQSYVVATAIFQSVYQLKIFNITNL